MTSSAERRYIPAFDGSRGLASLFVLVAHFGFFQSGWVAVQYFFILSGYLITSILVSQRERTPALGPYLKEFFKRRSLRIFPVYYGFLAVCTVTFFVFGKPAALKRVWAYLVTYTYNLYLTLPGHPLERYFSHLWSLSAEEHFYLVWPFAIFFLRGRALRGLVLGVLVAVPVIRILSHLYAQRHGIPPNVLGAAMYMGSGFQFDAFVAGAAIAIFRWQGLRWAARAFLMGSVVALVYGVTVMNLYPEPVQPRTDTLFLVRQGLSLGFPLMMLPRAQYLWGYSLVNLLSVLLVIAMMQPNWISRVLSHPALVRLGRMSYTIYVIHLPIQAILQDHYRAPLHTVTGFLLMFPYMAVVILIAHLSYTYYEVWFRREKDPGEVSPAAAVA